MTLTKAVCTCHHATDIRLILAGRGPLEDQYQAFGQALPIPPILRFYAHEELAEKIDDWFEHREDLPAMDQRYIDLARTLTIEESAKKVRRMMMDAIQEKRQPVPREGRDS